MVQVPAIVLLKTVVILTISGKRQEKTVGIKSYHLDLGLWMRKQPQVNQMPQ